MTKINLLQSLGASQSPGVFAAGSSVGPAEPKQAALKLVVILLFPLGLYIFQNFNLSVLQAGKAESQAKLQAVRQQVSKFGDAGPRYEEFSKMKAQIDKQTAIIRTLAVNRLREVKALDTLQTMTPPQVWFRSIKINNGILSAQGLATSEEGVAALYSSLNTSSLFSRFEPGTQAEETIGGSVVKRFDFQFQIGKAEQPATNQVGK